MDWSVGLDNDILMKVLEKGRWAAIFAMGARAVVLGTMDAAVSLAPRAHRAIDAMAIAGNVLEENRVVESIGAFAISISVLLNVDPQMVGSA